MSTQLQNYIAGQWIAGSGEQTELTDASAGELIGTTSSGGLDFVDMHTQAERENEGRPLLRVACP